MKNQIQIVIYLAAALALIPIGCSGILEAKPRNSDLFYRGHSAAVLALAALPGVQPTPLMRATPREPETLPQSPMPETNEEPSPEPPTPVETPPPQADRNVTPANVEPPEHPEENSEKTLIDDGAPAEEKPAEPTPISLPLPEPEPAKFIPREAPPEAKRQIWYFGGKWCGPCRSTKPEVELFARSRSLVARQSTEPDADKADIVFYEITPEGLIQDSLQPVPLKIGPVPLLAIVDGKGKELSRIEGGSNFSNIEDLWLNGPKRPHGLNGLPVDVPWLQANASVVGFDFDWGKLIGTARLTTTRLEDVILPIPEVGELVIPKSVTVTATPWEGGTKVAVEKGTPCPYVKSKWLGNLYPVPITAVSVSTSRAIVELRGWSDIEINLRGGG